MRTEEKSSSLNKNSKSSNIMLIFEELIQPDGKPGRTIKFTDAIIRPLSFADLIGALPQKPLSIPLEMPDCKIIGSDADEGLEGKYAKLSAKLSSPFTSRAIGLVKGGWLPPYLAATQPNASILVDRNIVTAIVSLFLNGKTNGDHQDFLCLFADMPIRINPMLYAMEGNNKSIPNANLIRAQLDEVMEKLQRALPEAQLIVGPASLQAAVEIIEDLRDRMECDEKFLLNIAPSLSSPVAKRNVQTRWDEALLAADDCGVPRDSLIVLAVLSSIAVPNGNSPAKRLLKFKTQYTKSDAYNALVDLRSLEFLSRLFAMFPEERPQLCTADRDLALFWTGIQAHDFVCENNEVTYFLSPVEELLPGDALRQWSADILL